LAETGADRDRPYTGVLEETIESRETYFRGRVFDVEKRQVLLPDGYKSEREIVLHPGGAAIVALDADNNVFLVRQYRSAAMQPMLEIPAGRLEKGEDPKAAAIRELREETGLTAEPDKVELLTEVYATPGYCSEKLSIYFTKCDFAAGKPHRDAGELLRCEKLLFTEAWSMAVTGRLKDSKTVVGLCLAKERLDTNR
jgi:ADP-ribose pyrophosphatase